MSDSSTTTSTQDLRHLDTYYVANRSAGASLESLDIDRKTLEAYGRRDLNKLIGRLEVELHECLEPDWDGYGASAISSAAIYSCANFLCGFQSNAVNVEATPEPDGDISLEWYADPEFNLSISFGSRKELPYSCFLGKERHYGIIQRDKENPEISWWLNEITERYFQKEAASD